MKNKFDVAVKQVIDLKMRAVSVIIKELIEPLRVTENPEELIGKPYEQWDIPEDLNLLEQVYGSSDDTPLAKLIFDKKYKRVKELESEEL